MQDLKLIAKEIRKKTLICISTFGSGHIGGSLSIVDVLTVLYFNKMNVDPTNPSMEARDRLVVSKGHAGPAVYATLAEKGFIEEKELLTLNKIHTNLPSHCDMNKVKGVDMTTGSLGQGISCAVGIALGSKIKKDNAHIYCIIGDGEAQEGEVWEALEFASNKCLDNLIVFLDYNKCQIDGTIDKVNSVSNFKERFEALNLDTYSIDGNDVDEISKTIDEAQKVKGKAHAIILNTVKGKGVKYIEDMGFKNHSIPISYEDLEKAIEELERGE